MPGHENLFFHISTFAYHHRRPAADTAVTVLAVPGQKGGWQASRVLLREHEQAIMEEGIYDIAENSQPKKLEGYLYAFLDVLYFLGLTLISIPLAISSAIISVLTVALYRYDKRAAEQGTQRIPNSALHLASLLGGWPGALIAARSCATTQPKTLPRLLLGKHRRQLRHPLHPHRLPAAVQPAGQLLTRTHPAPLGGEIT